MSNELREAIINIGFADEWREEGLDEGLRKAVLALKKLNASDEYICSELDIPIEKIPSYVAESAAEYKV